MSTLPSPLTYIPFPTEALPHVLRRLVRSGAPAVGCDEASLALPALIAAAGVLGSTRRLQLQSTWQAPPILWGCLLGESGAGKSPAMRLALAPLREYERRARAAERANVHSRFLEAARSTGRPALRRVLVSDATTEALAQIAAEHPLGLLLARDELAGFFGNLDRYGAQAGADEAFFLSAYDGEPVDVDRKAASEHIYVPAMALSILGTCQPAVFAKFMTDQRRASGLLARFLLIEPPTPPKVWNREGVNSKELDEALNDWADTIEDLLRLEAKPCPAGGLTHYVVDLAPDAAELYGAFFNAHNAAAAKETGDRRAFYSKAEQLPLRLALVLHHLEWVQPTDTPAKTIAASVRANVDSPLRIAAPTMHSALTLAWWFIQETLRVYDLLALKPEERLALELEQWIRARGGKTTVAEIHREAPEKFREPKSLAELLLNTLARQSRGSWGPMIIWPVCIDIFHPMPDPGPVKPREFCLKGLKRAA